MGRTVKVILGVVLGLFAAIGVVFAGAAVIAAVANAKAPAVDAGRPTPPPTTRSFSETEWSIVTPAGWTREDITKDADAKKAIRYSHTDGSYFIVAIDPLGSGYSYDALWTYKVKGSGFEIVEKLNCGGPTAEPCDNDGRFDGYILWKTGTTPTKVGGHTWYFMFGNSKTATVDSNVFEQIVTSITVK